MPEVKSASQRRAELDSVKFIEVRELATMKYKRLDERGNDQQPPLMTYQETLSKEREQVKNMVVEHELKLGSLGRPNDSGFIIVPDEQAPQQSQPNANGVHQQQGAPMSSPPTPPGFAPPPAPPNGAQPPPPGYAAPPPPQWGPPAGPPGFASPGVPQPPQQPPAQVTNFNGAPQAAPQPQAFAAPGVPMQPPAFSPPQGPPTAPPNEPAPIAKKGKRGAATAPPAGPPPSTPPGAMQQPPPQFGAPPPPQSYQPPAGPPGMASMPPSFGPPGYAAPPAAMAPPMAPALQQAAPQAAPQLPSDIVARIDNLTGGLHAVNQQAAATGQDVKMLAQNLSAEVAEIKQTLKLLLVAQQQQLLATFNSQMMGWVQTQEGAAWLDTIKSLDVYKSYLAQRSPK